MGHLYCLHPPPQSQGVSEEAIESLLLHMTWPTQTQIHNSYGFLQKTYTNLSQPKSIIDGEDWLSAPLPTEEPLAMDSCSGWRHYPIFEDVTAVLIPSRVWESHTHARRTKQKCFTESSKTKQTDKIKNAFGREECWGTYIGAV